MNNNNQFGTQHKAVSTPNANSFDSGSDERSVFNSDAFKEAVRSTSIEALWEHYELPNSPASSCHSPFREEQNPSFSVYRKPDGAWRFKDHGCPEHHGDAYEFFLLASRREKSGASAEEFLEYAATHCGNGHGQPNRPAGMQTIDFSEVAATCSETLRFAPEIQEQLAHSLGVNVSTIQQVAEEGSLGFSAEQSGMTVHTPSGIQVRAIDGTKRNIQGSRQDVWRGDAARSASHVILTEGASDAIAAIDAGLEEDGTTVVVALPSASTSFSEPGIGVLAGKDVTLVPDRDEAGRRLEQKAKECLVQTTASLSIFSWDLVRGQRPNLNNDVKDLRDLHALLGAEVTKELISTCSQPVGSEDGGSSSNDRIPISNEEDAIEPLSSSLPDVLEKEVDRGDELIQHGFLRKGQTMLIVAPSGAGKSSWTMQIGVSFALHRECLGFHPVRPLKVLLVQSENDDADQKEVAQGVCGGLGITGHDIEILRERLFFRECQDSGDGFLEGVLRKLIRERSPDLVIIDPYGDFQSDTANNEQQVKTFLVRLRQILKESKCGCILVHHTPKPSKERNSVGPYDEQYRGYGTSLLSNHVRASILLKPTNSRGFFEIKAVKRGERLRWVDGNGEPTFSKFIRHADPGQGIYWMEATPEEVAAQMGIELGADGQPRKGADDVIRFLQGYDEAVEKARVVQHLNTDPGKLGVNNAASLLGRMVAEELIFEHALPREGRKAAVGFSLKPAGEASSTSKKNPHGRDDHGMRASP